MHDEALIKAPHQRTFGRGGWLAKAQQGSREGVAWQVEHLAVLLGILDDIADVTRADPQGFRPN